MVRELLGVWLLVLGLASRASAEPAVLPETRLPLRLIGTVVAAQAERSIAVIENSGATAVVRTGDAIGPARVLEIRKDGVVLAQAGQLEQLTLASVAIPSRSAGSGQASASASSGGASAGDRDAGDPDPQRASAASRGRARARRATAVPASAARGQESEAGSAALETVTTDQLLVNLSSQARYAPLLDGEGQLRGVAILDVLPDSTLERLGLRSGDVVVSVAGVRVDNSSAAFDALRALNPRAGGEVLVERQGVPTRITVPPGAL